MSLHCSSYFNDGAYEGEEQYVVRSPEDGAKIASQFIGEDDREVFFVMCLNTKNRVVAVHRCHVGALNASLVTQREVFKSANLNNSASSIVSHQHPSQRLSFTSAMLAFLNGRRKTVIYLIIQGIFTWLGAGTAILLSNFKDFQEQIVATALSLTAGIFLYLSGTSLLPSINQRTFKSTPLFFISGILLYFILHSIAEALS